MKNSVSRLSFLKNVFVCSLAAYGGPEAHYSVFINQLTVKNKYLSETELIELIALCSILPGPTSTQTITAIGYKTGGPVLALLTLFIWAFPAIAVMSLISFLYIFLDAENIDHLFLKYIGPMALGFIITASVRITRKTVHDKITIFLFLNSILLTFFIRSPLIFPAVLIFSGICTMLISKEKNIYNRIRISPPWIYLWSFIFIGIGLITVKTFFEIRIISLFESFYRYGYLVFGGGQVVIPLMYNELVELSGFMTSPEFLTGYGLVQGLPGPMFSFAAYAGGMASRGGTLIMQTAGALAGGIGIFLPGTLLIFFIYPVWENLKKMKAISLSLKGINASAAGMITSAALVISVSIGFKPEYIAVSVITAILLAFKKIPAPLIVIAAIAAGWFIKF